jgi:hypothetical protein
MQGVYGKAVGVLSGKINVVDLPVACKRETDRIDEYLKLIKLLR